MTNPGQRGGAPWRKGWKPGEWVKPMERFGSMIEDRTELQERSETEAADGKEDVLAARGRLRKKS